MDPTPSRDNAASPESAQSIARVEVVCQEAKNNKFGVVTITYLKLFIFISNFIFLQYGRLIVANVDHKLFIAMLALISSDTPPG
uniref:7TM_GPCR_Srx domain-containing protein n=1 Tax=Caenorhabditis tropicalis TaxID=1561998 RepID=A0A1I7TLS3_9PELO